MTTTSRVALFGLLITSLLLACEAESRFHVNPGDGDADADADGDGDGDGDGDSDSDADGDGDSDSDADTDKACDVDLLFVIDNSISMWDYQTALGLAFPQFADALVAALPPATNVHVGVTSTEMGYSSQGSNSQSNTGCTFTGDNGQDETAFYITPDQIDTLRNGAQGRLYQPAGHPIFYDIDLDSGPDQIDQLKEWFKAAAAVGTGGSQIEMLIAPVGWVVDPANDDTNAGFIRDAGTVTVVFFMQDEPDQTPLELDGIDGGEAMLNRLVSAKSACGGLDCIVAGGFTRPEQCGGTRPIKSFLDGLTRPTAVQPLPDDNTPPAQMAEEMAELLTSTLLEVIEDTCNAIIIE